MKTKDKEVVLRPPLSQFLPHSQSIVSRYQNSQQDFKTQNYLLKLGIYINYSNNYIDLYKNGIIKHKKI